MLPAETDHELRSDGKCFDSNRIWDRKHFRHNIRKFFYTHIKKTIFLHDLLQTDLRQTVHLIVVLAVEEIVAPQMIVREKEWINTLILEFHIREKLVPAGQEDIFFLSVWSKEGGEIRQTDDRFPVLLFFQDVQGVPHQVPRTVRGAAPGMTFAFYRKTFS